MEKLRNKAVLNQTEINEMITSGQATKIIGHANHIITDSSNVYDLKDGSRQKFVFKTDSREKHVRLFNEDRTRVNTIRVRDLMRVHFGSISRDKTFKQVKIKAKNRDIDYLYHTDTLQIDVRNYNIVPLKKLETDYSFSSDIQTVNINDLEFKGYYSDGTVGSSYARKSLLRFNKIGTIRKDGYVNIKYVSKEYGTYTDVEHRAMKKMYDIDGYGALGFANKNEDKAPRTHVDHINNIRDDNRLNNLQYVTPYENNHLKHLRIELDKLKAAGQDTSAIPKIWNGLIVYR